MVRKLGFIYTIAFVLVSFVCSCVSTGGAAAKEKKALKGETGPQKREEKGIVYIPEHKLPKKVLVLFPVADKGVKVDKQFSLMLRSVLQNYLSSKGYIVRYADKLPASLSGAINPDDFKDIFSKVPDIDGYISVKVFSFSGVNAVFVKLYRLDAQICMYSRKYGKLGCWRDSVSRRRISISTDPIGIAAQVLGSVLSDTSTTKKKTLIMEWAYNISSLIPGFSFAEKKPKIYRVITNVSGKFFKMGDRIVVAAEGDPGMDAYFDIGTFKRNIKMVETSKPGIYQGVYVVQRGDDAVNQYIVVRLLNSQGEKSEWLELEPPVNIDGIPPKPPVDVSYAVLPEGVRLSWRCVDGTTVAFEIFRSLQPLSGYSLLGKTADLKFEDRTAKPGVEYYYRIVALDSVGNRSAPLQVGPVRVPVRNALLNGTVVGSLVPGTYLLGGKLEIPPGKSLVASEGVHFRITNSTELKVGGTLELYNADFDFEGNGTLIVRAESGSALKVRNVNFKTAKIFLNGTANIEDARFYDRVVVGKDADVVMKRVKFSSETPLVVNGGRLRLIECEFRKCKVGVEVVEGNVVVEKSNFFDVHLLVKNRRGNVLVKESYLGSSDPATFRVEGEVKIASFLDMPYPDGNVVKYDPERLKKEAESLVSQAVSYVKKGNYGNALELLNKAYRLDKSKQVYYWLAYVYTMMGEDDKLSRVIDEAMERYPYEVNIYQLAVRYYIFKGNYKQAGKILERALKLQPNNPTLLSLKALLDSMMKKR